MLPDRPLAALALPVLFVAFAFAAANSQAEPKDASAASLVVELADGRRMTGELASETDENRLWIRRSASGVTICSGFAWNSVEGVQSGNTPVSPAHLRMLARRQTARKIDLEDVPGPLNAHLEAPPAELPPAAVRSARLASLRIEACLANWDQDPQRDGLLVFVFPLDAGGRLAPVHGQLDLTLVGVTQVVGGTAWQKTPEFPELERKSHLVRLGDFAEGPAIFRVPFVRLEPEYDARLDWPALLHARLRVPGVGAFDASTTCLALREFSPLRDHLWQHTGRRFLPLEDAGRAGR
jgi:hypothetical protein